MAADEIKSHFPKMVSSVVKNQSFFYQSGAEHKERDDVIHWNELMLF